MIPRNVCRAAVALIALASIATALAADPATVQVVGMEFARAVPGGLRNAPSHPGTRIKLLLDHNDADWRGVDVPGSRLSAFADNRGGNLALSEAVDGSGLPAGFIADACEVSGDGKRALVTIWGSGLPVDRAESIRVAGSVSFYSGSAIETSVDRADVRLAGGETFNVQPFRVVTGKGEGGAIFVELRYLKSAAIVQRVTLTTAAGPAPATGQTEVLDNGTEWVWRGNFERPERVPTGTLGVTFLPIEKTVSVPFDLETGVAFAEPTKNPILRWIRERF